MADFNVLEDGDQHVYMTQFTDSVVQGRNVQAQNGGNVVSTRNLAPGSYREQYTVQTHQGQSSQKIISGGHQNEYVAVSHFNLQAPQGYQTQNIVQTQYLNGAPQVVRRSYQVGASGIQGGQVYQQGNGHNYQEVVQRKSYSNQLMIPTTYQTNVVTTETQQVLAPTVTGSYQVARKSLQPTAISNIVSNESVRYGDPRIISESKMQSRIVETKEGQAHVVDVKYGQSYEVNRSTHVGTDVRVRENRLEVREQRPSFTQANMNKDITIKSEKAVINQRIVEKPVDVYIEKPVPIYKTVEVPYDVIIEKPIEKIIERDVITEIVMEKPIEKIIEIPVHKVIEVPIQKTIERPVYIDKYVDIPRQVFKDTTKEIIVETPVYVDKVIEVEEKDIAKYKYDRVLPTEVKVFEKPIYREQKRAQKNIIEKVVEVPVEKVIQRPVQKVVERPVERLVEKQVIVDNIIEKIVEVPVENIIYNRIEQIVEEPEYIEQIIEKPVHIERIVERPVEHIEEVIVEKPVYIDRVVEKEVERIVEKEVIINKEVKVPIQRMVERPVYKERIVTKEVPKIIEQEVIYETTVPVERVNIVEEVIPVPIDRIIERPIERTVEKYVDVVIEKEIFEDNLVEDVQYIEKIVQVPLERIVERPVYKENIIEKNVFIEKIVEKNVDVPVEKIIEVPVERIVEVPFDVIVENPITRQKIVEREVYIDKKVAKPRASQIRSGVEDSNLRFQVQTLESRISETKISVSKIKAEWEILQKKQMNVTLRSDIDYTSQNLKLRELIAEIENKIRNFKPAVTRKSYNEGGQVISHSQSVQQSHFKQ